MTSPSPSSGMPGGSWTIQDEEPNGRIEPQDSGTPVDGLDGFVPSAEEAIGSRKPEGLRSEILELGNSAKLEEIVLLASPSRETWRVRISPDYDIEILGPIQQQDGGDVGISGPRHRYSPQQRRSRCLDTIFPDIRDDFHSASRASRDNAPVPSVLDLDWDFSQYDLSRIPNTDENALALAFQSLPVNGIAHDEAVDGTDSPSGTPPAGPSSPRSTLRPSDSPSRPVLRTETGVSSSSFGDSDNSQSVDRAVNGAEYPTGSTLPPSVPPSPEKIDETESPAASPFRPSLHHGQQSTPNDVNPTHFSPSTGTSSPGAPSTARPSVSPSNPSVRPDGGAASSSGFDSDDSETPSHQVSETADDQLLTPSSLGEAFNLPDQHDSESLPSAIIHPAPSSALSEYDDDNEDGADAHSDSDPEELEYLDEPPALTLMSFWLDPLPLDSGFGSPDDWEVVGPPSPNGLAQTQTAFALGHLPEIGGTTSTTPGEATGINEVLAEASAPLEDPLQSSSASLDERSTEAAGVTVLEETIHHADTEIEGDEKEPQESKGDQESGGGQQFPENDSLSQDDDWTPELPALHFHSPSLTDEVLSSPEFTTVAFRHGQEHSPGGGAAPTPILPRSRRVRVGSTSNIERTSILWAPQESKYVEHAGAARGKGKARSRARTLSGDSGFAETETVAPEVQTQADDELRAKYARLKKKYRIEKARVAGLARGTGRETEGWDEAKLGMLKKLFSWGFPIHFEDAIL
ncbi:hypothetical protein DFH07DRAFT_940049 [Mycena maculata]|uniref:Uncharacterized protein n=1 Tax=Mycena maculata TaxID=230809 RepID=A0AAD7J9G2_9AGAR|nr:hypothetical protein DFH07DRAFT_940049 [Mycena maculata]